jgi:hypothetical protein
MKLDEYQTLAKKIAIYPGELTYPALGLCGEIGELLSALGDGDDDEITKEIGDVLWYVANMAADAGLTLSEVMGRKTFPNHNSIIYANNDHIIDAIILAGGEVAENVKKTLRDDEGKICDRRRTKIKKALKIIVRELNNLCWTMCDSIQLVDCAEINIAKLQSRQARGKLKGDGDNR